jgi:hypothetical protein
VSRHSAQQTANLDSPNGTEAVDHQLRGGKIKSVTFSHDPPDVHACVTRLQETSPGPAPET